MGGGGRNTTTTTSGSTNPMVDTTVTNLLTRLNTQVGQGTAVFDRSLYGGMSDTTRDGIGNLTARAAEGQGGADAAYGWAQGTVNNGGYNEGLSNAQGGYQAIANDGGYNPALNEAQSGIREYLRESQANAPGYSALRQRGIDDALTGVGSSFLTDGRFGSSAMGDAAGEAASDVALGFDYQNYNDRLGRMLGGNQALAGIGQTAMGNRMGALSGVAGTAQTAMGNAGAAASALPGFASARLQPAQMQIAAGQMLDADAQARLQGDNDLFRRQNDAGWSTLGQASSILNGTAGASGQQSSTSAPGTPWWQTLAGGAIGLGSMFL